MQSVWLSDSLHFYPYICLCKCILPILVKCSCSWIYLQDPAVYPYFDLYPPVEDDALRSVFGPSEPNAPPQSQVSIRPGAYPFFVIYPALSKQPVKVVSGKLDVLYPAFNLCESGDLHSRVPSIEMVPDPAVYPHFDLYNTGSIQNANDPYRSSNGLPAKYPVIMLCEETLSSHSQSTTLIINGRFPCLPPLRHLPGFDRYKSVIEHSPHPSS